MMCGSAQTGGGTGRSALAAAAAPRIETGGQLHLYFYGIGAEDIAAILDRRNE